MVVGHRRHVDHDEPLDELGPEQGDEHGDLAAHRVPDQGDRVAVGQDLGDPVGVVDVVEAVAARRLAVVGQVHEQDPVVAGQGLRDRGPVLALAEEPVTEDDGRAGLAERSWRSAPLVHALG